MSKSKEINPQTGQNKTVIDLKGDMYGFKVNPHINTTGMNGVLKENDSYQFFPLYNKEIDELTSKGEIEYTLPANEYVNMTKESTPENELLTRGVINGGVYYIFDGTKVSVEASKDNSNVVTLKLYKTPIEECKEEVTNC